MPLLFLSILSNADEAESDEAEADADDDEDETHLLKQSTTADAHAHLMDDQGFRPVTRGQLDNGWFNMRTLSLTSSAVDKLIIAAAPYIDPDHAYYKHFKQIFEYSGQAHLLAKAKANAEDDDNNDSMEDDQSSCESDDGVSSVSDEMVQRLIQPNLFSDIQE